MNKCFTVLALRPSIPEPDFFESPKRPTKPCPTSAFSAFHPNGCCCCGSFPSARRWAHVPGVVGRLKISSVVCKPRPDIRVRIRGIVIRLRVRHTAIRVRVVVATINHTAYGGTLPCWQSYSINMTCKDRRYKNSQTTAAIPPPTAVIIQSIQSQ